MHKLKDKVTQQCMWTWSTSNQAKIDQYIKAWQNSDERSQERHRTPTNRNDVD